jgi:ubiquinone/menaquinone biosynthesis C-methylase UbiE
MNKAAPAMNEQAAATAFSKQAPLFDTLYSSDSIIQYKRMRVRECVIKSLGPESHILELNAGTGDDAIFFAQRGHTLHATDISAGMQSLLEEKVIKNDLQNYITYELVSYTNLENLFDRGPYDMIFSNLQD